MTANRLIAIRSTVGALLALLAFGAAWPPGAQAGCSNAHGPSPGRGAAHLDRLAQAGALSAPIEEADPPRPVPRCTGLRCSKGPTSATPAIAPAVERWGCLADLDPGPDITSSGFPCEEPAVRPRHRGESPFHPPR